jgi:hypothetical protein
MCPERGRASVAPLLLTRCPAAGDALVGAGAAHQDHRAPAAGAAEPDGQRWAAPAPAVAVAATAALVALVALRALLPQLLPSRSASTTAASPPPLPCAAGSTSRLGRPLATLDSRHSTPAASLQDDMHAGAGGRHSPARVSDTSTSGSDKPSKLGRASAELGTPEWPQRPGAGGSKTPSRSASKSPIRASSSSTPVSDESKASVVTLEGGMGSENTSIAAGGARARRIPAAGPGCLTAGCPPGPLAIRPTRACSLLRFQPAALLALPLTAPPPPCLQRPAWMRRLASWPSCRTRPRPRARWRRPWAPCPARPRTACSSSTCCRRCACSWAQTAARSRMQVRLPGWRSPLRGRSRFPRPLASLLIPHSSSAPSPRRRRPPQPRRYPGWTSSSWSTTCRTWRPRSWRARCCWRVAAAPARRARPPAGARAAQRAWPRTPRPSTWALTSCCSSPALQAPGRRCCRRWRGRHQQRVGAAPPRPAVPGWLAGFRGCVAWGGARAHSLPGSWRLA